MAKAKKLTALFLALVMALTLVACSEGKDDDKSNDGQSGGPEGGKTIELTFYYPTQVGGALATGMEEMVADFNSSHPGIHVTPVYTGSYKNTAQTAMTDIAGGNAPNVILSGMLDIVDYYNIGAVKDLSSLIAAEGDAWKSDFIDGFWGNFVYPDGGTYGLPYQHSICVLYYNKDKLAEAGISKAPYSWDEYLKACQDLQKKDSKTVSMEFPSDVWVLEALTLANGDKLCDGTKAVRFDSKAAVDSLGMMQKMIQSGGMVQTYATAAEDFIAESCAMMLNTTGNLGFVINSATFNWGVALPPVNTNPGLSYGGGGLIMISGQPAEEEAASWEFMKWMTEPEQSARWMTISGYFCVRKSCDNLAVVKDYYAANPQVGEAAALLQYTTAQWTTDSYWDVYAHMQTALDSVLLNGADAGTALAQAQKDATAVLNK